MLWHNDVYLTLFSAGCNGADEVPPAWDPSFHGSAMMVPVLFVTWVVGVLLLSVLLYVGLRLNWQRRHAPRPHAWLPQIDEEPIFLECKKERSVGSGKGG